MYTNRRVVQQHPLGDSATSADSVASEPTSVLTVVHGVWGPKGVQPTQCCTELHQGCGLNSFNTWQVHAINTC
jgi:hypothetical protein